MAGKGHPLQTYISDFHFRLPFYDQWAPPAIAIVRMHEHVSGYGERLSRGRNKQKKSAPADPESRSSDSSNQEVMVPSRAEGMEFPSLL